MRSLRKVVAVALVSAMMATSMPAPVSAAKKANVKKVTVESSLTGNKKTVYVAKGKTAKLKATVKVTPNKKANKGVTYKTSNKKVATVNNKGIVKGVKSGTAKITVASKKNKKKKTTITVKVMNAAVKKVKLNKKKATLNIGDALTLKAKVTASKKACKKVVWTSSKKKVATVTKKGVVKAVGVGSTTITAKAVDGSGKKATCKIKVQNSVNLVNMDVLNAQTVTFSLDRAQQLTADQITIKTKANASGEYRKTLKIDSLTTADGINYNAILNNETRIYVNDYVQVSVPALAGEVKTLEKQYLQQVCAFTGDDVSTWEVGEYDARSFWFEDENGYSELSISGIPAGLTAEVKAGYIKVKGTPTAAGISNAVLTAVDEYGNTLNKNITFAVGSDTTVVAAAAPKYTLICAKDVYASVTGYAVGGSGSYKYEIVADPQNSGAKLDDYSGRYFEIESNIAVAGDYNVTVRVTDKNDASRVYDTVVTLHVAQGITVGGCIKDAQGNPMVDAEIYFDNKNRADRYFTGGYFSMNSETSVYSAIISPGTYDIRAYRSVEAEEGCATNYLYSQNLTATQSGYDISLPLYKVAFASNDQTLNDAIKYKTWYVNNAEIGYGSVIYAKAGNYNFETSEFTEDGESKLTNTTGDWFNGQTKVYTVPKGTYKYTSAINVVDAAVMAPITKTTVKDESTTKNYYYSAAKNTVYTAQLDRTYYFDDTETDEYEDNYYNSYYNAFKFAPSETAKYKVSDTSVKVYDSTGKVLTGTNGVYSLESEKTYFLGTGSYDSSSKSFKITKEEVTTQAPATTTQTPATTTQSAASTTTQSAAATTQAK